MPMPLQRVLESTNLRPRFPPYPAVPSLLKWAIGRDLSVASEGIPSPFKRQDWSFEISAMVHDNSDLLIGDDIKNSFGETR